MAGEGLPVGTLLEGRYRVDEVVAEGGFGVVHAGRHLLLDLPIAIKVLHLHPARGDAADQIARFLDEARTLSRLRHPNVVRVLDVGVLDAAGGPRPWLVMEWCAGTTLRDDLAARAGAPRTVAETWRLMRPLLDAAAAAHAVGVAHRDIKPSNIMLVDEGEAGISARLIDFGIAKKSDLPIGSGDTKTHGPQAFTPGYAAPEQLAGTRTGTWTDVHALALVLTEMLVGRAPYGDDPEAADIIDEARPTPGRFGVDVGGWEAVLARALAMKTTERPRHAGELLAELDAAVGTALEASAVPATITAAPAVTPRRITVVPVSPVDATELETLEGAASARDRTRVAKAASQRLPLLTAGALATIGVVAWVGATRAPAASWSGSAATATLASAVAAPPPVAPSPSPAEVAVPPPPPAESIAARRRRAPAVPASAPPPPPASPSATAKTPTLH